MTFRTLGDVQIPLPDDASWFSLGFGGSLSADFHFWPVLTPFAELGAVYQQVLLSDPMVLLNAGAGIGLGFKPLENLQLRLDGSGGLYGAFWGTESAAQNAEEAGEAPYLVNYYAAGKLEADLRLTPFLTLSGAGGLTCYIGPSAPLLTAATARIGLTFHPGGIDALGARVTVKEGSDPPLGTVFPVFYSYYDDHPLGSVSIYNGEEAEVRDVRVSFRTGEYMDQYKTCATYPSLKKGASTTAPLYAIFNDQVLTLTANTRVAGKVKVDYTLFGSPRTAELDVTLAMAHRNAMTWDDDRKAAAFVSPTDPAALWFSRFITAIARDRLRGDIARNLQFAVAIFEAENLFQLNYVVDPSSSYADKASSEETIDYLQYPFQTLFFRGGDCDDLSILFTTLLESVGIRTAFITIPGHIYAAFMLGMSEEEAKAKFFDPSLLIFQDGQAWVPVEITMIKEGFVKAWRVAVKEWTDNVRNGGKLWPMADSWKLFPSVGVPGVNPRFSLPDEVETVKAFDESMNKLVARQMDPLIRDYKVAVQTDDSPERANQLGIQYGRFGMLKEAWAQFTKAANASYSYAWTNLGNVAFLQEDYALALTYFEYVLQSDPDDTAAILGNARSNYELENFTESDAAYAKLKTRDPVLAGKYGYLASDLAGQGRAWSFTDRLQTTVWAGTGKQGALGTAVAKEPAGKPVQVESTPKISEKPAEDAQLAAKAAAAKPAETPDKPAPPVVAELPKDKQLEAKTAATAKPATEPVKEAPLAAPAKPEPVPAKVESVPAKIEPAPGKPAPPVVAELPKDKKLEAKTAATVKPAAEPVKEAPLAAPAKPEPAPAKVESAPAKVESAPAKVESAPAKIEPAPAKIEPAPAKIEPAPAKVEPVPAKVEPVPAKVEPAPAKIEPAPAKVEPVPAKVEPVPAKVEPEPAKVEPVPAKIEPVPAKIEPEPAKIEPVPAKVEPEPAKVEPVPAKIEPVPAKIEPEPAKIEPVPAKVEPEPAKIEPEPAMDEPEARIAVVVEMPAASPAIQTSPPEQQPTAAAVRTAPPEQEPAEKAVVTAQPEPMRPEPGTAFAMSEAILVAILPERAPPPAETPAEPDKPAVVAETPVEKPIPIPPLSNGSEEHLLVAKAETSAKVWTDFRQAIPAVGRWSLETFAANQTDPKQFYAKLATPLLQAGVPMRYSFTARSQGIGWVGSGIHLYVHDMKNLKGFGAGKSILVWLTYDPVHYPPDAKKRLQIYRSMDDVNMEMKVDQAVPEMIKNETRFTIEVDPAAGEVVVFLDGNERVRAKGFQGLGSGVSVVFRSLDTAEFRDFRAEEKR